MAYHKQRLFEQIEIHLTAHPRISQAELERNLGVERHTIENLIKENTGVSFREHTQGLLLAQAIRLLRSEPNLSIKQISFMLGFAWPSDFSRFIKKRTGRTPTQIRQLPPEDF